MNNLLTFPSPNEPLALYGPFKAMFVRTKHLGRIKSWNNNFYLAEVANKSNAESSLFSNKTLTCVVSDRPNHDVENKVAKNGGN